jgi:hypothetical protein
MFVSALLRKVLILDSIIYSCFGILLFFWPHFVGDFFLVCSIWEDIYILEKFNNFGNEPRTASTGICFDALAANCWARLSSAGEPAPNGACPN